MEEVKTVIFYFSGTGNSLYVAKEIAKEQNTTLVSIAKVINENKHFEFELKDDEVIGLVFPVYAWGPPNMVKEFIEKVKLKNYNANYVFAVSTCGENIGNTMEILEKSLKNISLTLDSAFSIEMPNNYIIIGDIYTDEKAQTLLMESEKKINDINRNIKNREKGILNVVKGPIPGVLSTLANPMFNRYGIDSKKFFASDKCIECGICRKVCNCQNISLNPRPVWGNKCAQCLACIHYCPKQAIQYGKSSHKKGRYVNPNVTVNEMYIIE